MEPAKIDPVLKKGLIAFFITILGFIASMLVLDKLNSKVAKDVDKYQAIIEASASKK